MPVWNCDCCYGQNVKFWLCTTSQYLCREPINANGADFPAFTTKEKLHANLYVHQLMKLHTKGTCQLNDRRLKNLGSDSASSLRIADVVKTVILTLQFCSVIGSCNAAIWAAVRASSAAPGYFNDFHLDGMIHQDGGILTNNATHIAIHEAHRWAAPGIFRAFWSVFNVFNRAILIFGIFSEIDGFLA